MRKAELITDMRWEDYGDKYAKNFYSDWLDKAGRIDNPLDAKHKQKLLWTEMKKSHGLKWELDHIKDYLRRSRPMMSY